MKSLTQPDRTLDRLALLKQIPVFAALSEDQLRTICQDLALRRYAHREIIFHQGDSAADLDIILTGKVRIFHTAPSGNETLVNIISTGDILGEFGALDAQPRSATAQAIGAVSLLQISKDRFVAYLSDIPPLALQVVRQLVAKLRWTTAYAETIAQYDAAGRLLHILLQYNDRFGEEQIPGKRSVIDLGLNQSDLASLVGVRREWVNHILQDWHKRGLIEYNAGKIILLDLPRVHAERDSRIEASLGNAKW